MIKLDEKDREKLVKVHLNALSAPVITFGAGMPSMADTAWDRVREFMEELGEKYGFDPSAIKGIDSKTGEVKL